MTWLTAFSTPYARVDEELFRVQIGPTERRKLLLIKPEVDSVLTVDSQCSDTRSSVADWLEQIVS